MVTPDAKRKAVAPYSNNKLGFDFRAIRAAEFGPGETRQLADIGMDIINHRKEGSRFYNRVLIAQVWDGRGDGRWSKRTSHLHKDGQHARRADPASADLQPS